MYKLVLILFFILFQTNFARWEPCKNGLQTNEVSCFNAESVNQHIDKNGERIMAANDDDYWFTKNNRLSNMRISLDGNNISAIPENDLPYKSANVGVESKYIDSKNSAAKTFMAIIGNNVYLGGEGVYLSTDYGNNWTKKNSGLIYLSEPGLIIYGDYIFAGTNNNGVFRAKLSELGITDVKAPYSGIEYNIFPNPASNEFSVRFYSPNETKVQITILNNLGKEVYSRLEQAGEGTNEKIIDSDKLASGNYFVKININNIEQTLPLVIVK